MSPQPKKAANTGKDETTEGTPPATDTPAGDPVADAQAQAEQILAQARETAQSAVDDARDQVDQLLAAATERAQSTAQSVINAANEQATTILEDARDAAAEDRAKPTTDDTWLEDDDPETSPYVVVGCAMLSYSTHGPGGLQPGAVARQHHLVELVDSEATRLAQFIRPATQQELEDARDRAALAAQATFTGPADNPYGGQPLETFEQHAARIRDEEAERAQLAASKAAGTPPRQ